MQIKNRGLLYSFLCNTSHRYAKHKCASAFGLLSSYSITICLKLNSSKMWNKLVIHLPSLPLLCLMLSYHVLPNPPLWVDCLHNFWFVSDCSNTTVIFLSAKPLYLSASEHLSQELRASTFCCSAKILKLTSLYCVHFWPELMQFLTCLRMLRIKPQSLGRGRFSKIISNSLNHHGSRKRYRFPLSERIYGLEARTQERKSLPSPPPSILQKAVLENNRGLKAVSLQLG